MLILPLLQSCLSQKVDVSDYTSEIVTIWNKKVIDFAIAEDNLFTLKGVRTTSMMHVAMHDALNAINIPLMLIKETCLVPIRL